MNLFNIQEASPADITLIRELTFKVWPQTYSNIISKEQIDYMLDMMYSVVSLQKQMKDGCQFLILYNEETPVGFASFQKMEHDTFKLHKIYILSDHQGKGIGRYFVEQILLHIKKQNGKSSQLQVNRHNKAKAFYERLGFVIIQEADFDIGNGYFMNDFVMEKKID